MPTYSIAVKIPLRELRALVAEEVFRNYLWSAGIAPGGIGGSSRTYTGELEPPPGLGSDAADEEDDTDEEHERNAELPGAVRSADRQPR